MTALLAVEGCSRRTPDEGTMSIDEQAGTARRLEIRELLDRYHAAVNTRDFALLNTLFAKQAVWEVGPPVNLHVEGRDAIVQAIRQSVERQEFLVQINSAVVIDLRDSNHASAHSTIVEFGREPGGKGMQVVGFYDDELVREDGAWKYARHAMRVQFMNDAPVEGRLVK
jgi:ketosteroid isomerase-like protein